MQTGFLSKTPMLFSFTDWMSVEIGVVIINDKMPKVEK